jgi:hypothetical protein
MAALAAYPVYSQVPEGVRRLAAQRHPKSVKSFLDRFLRLTEELQRSEFADLGAVALRTATTIYARDPYPYLQHVRERLAEIDVDETARRLPEWERKRIAANYDDPVGFVHEAAARVPVLAPRMGGVSEAQLLRYCVYYPLRAEELARGARVEATDIDRALDKRIRDVEVTAR